MRAGVEGGAHARSRARMPTPRAHAIWPAPTAAQHSCEARRCRPRGDARPAAAACAPPVGAHPDARARGPRARRPRPPRANEDHLSLHTWMTTETWSDSASAAPAPDARAPAAATSASAASKAGQGRVMGGVGRGGRGVGRVVCGVVRRGRGAWAVHISRRLLSCRRSGATKRTRPNGRGHAGWQAAQHSGATL